MSEDTREIEQCSKCNKIKELCVECELCIRCCAELQCYGD